MLKVDVLLIQFSLRVLGHELGLYCAPFRWRVFVMNARVHGLFSFSLGPFGLTLQRRVTRESASPLQKKIYAAASREPS